MLEMVPGFHTQKIVEEIFRLSENTSKSLITSDATAFDWLNKYIKSDTGKIFHPFSFPGSKTFLVHT